MTTCPLVIYHAGCRDGFAAAWAIKSLAALNQPWEFFAAYHGAPPPNVSGRDVVMVDFCYPCSILDQMCAQAHSVIVLDHHKSAMENIGDFRAPNTQIHFNMNRSGAMMAWKFYGAGKRPPWIINYVQDRDLWRNELPDSESVNAYISTIPFDFDSWTTAAAQNLNDVKAGGALVVKKVRQYVAEVRKNARRFFFHGYDVPLVNAPQVDISELLSALCENETFSMGWWQRADGIFQYSLRSRGDFDVSKLAVRHGGGGHKNAAGFQSERPIHF